MYQAGTITTVAGNGSRGYSGDGGPATAAQLAAPYDVALDAAGNLNIADQGNSRVRRVDLSGMIATVAGNGTPGFSGDAGPAVAAQLNRPQSVTLDSSGNLYIADSLYHCVRRVDTTGTISTVAGNGIRDFWRDAQLSFQPCRGWSRQPLHR
ncbi:MAG: hypothetical protein OXH99_11100 [Bryobacterales bacterium]|nr:hypothetical protein [Bryobacterales bacterium]